MRLSGIYCIHSKCKPKKKYIGSSVNIYERWETHLSHLRNKSHCNPKLQKHYDKYGETDLFFTVILTCDRYELNDIEQFFIDSLNPYFNVSKIANNKMGLRKPHSFRVSII
jgi:group I intron endonuclease